MANVITKNEDTTIKVPYVVTINNKNIVSVDNIKLIIRTLTPFDIAKVQYGHGEPEEYDKRSITSLLANVNFTYLNKEYMETIFISELVAVSYDEHGEIADFENDVEITDLETLDEEFIDEAIALALETIVSNINKRNIISLLINKVKDYDFIYPTDI